MRTITCMPMYLPPNPLFLPTLMHPSPSTIPAAQAFSVTRAISRPLVHVDSVLEDVVVTEFHLSNQYAEVWVLAVASESAVHLLIGRRDDLISVPHLLDLAHAGDVLPHRRHHARVDRAAEVHRHRELVEHLLGRLHLLVALADVRPELQF